jgi:hypothetical protein
MNDIQNSKLTLYRTASDTFRILIDGQVHPLFVGFLDASSAIKRALYQYPDQKVYLHSKEDWKQKDHYCLQEGAVIFVSGMQSQYWQEYNEYLELIQGKSLNWREHSDHLELMTVKIFIPKDFRLSTFL